LTIIDDYIDTEVAAIKAKTDQMVFTVANKIDSNIKAIDDSLDEATRLKQAVKATIYGKVHSVPLNKNTLLVKLLTNDVDADLNVGERLKNRVVILISGLARGEALGITSQAASASDPITLTVTDMAKFGDLAVNDEFVIV
jgi:hypothetical protein